MLKEKRLALVQGAQKTLELLEILGSENRSLPIGQLAAKLGVRRSEALLLLVTLESLGAAAWDGTRRVYIPTAPAMPRTGAAAPSSPPGRRAGAGGRTGVRHH